MGRVPMLQERDKFSTSYSVLSSTSSSQNCHSGARHAVCPVLRNSWGKKGTTGLRGS